MGDASMIEMAGYGLAVYLLLRVGAIFMIWHKLLRVVVRAGEYEVLPLDEIDASKRAFLQPAVSELEKHGFALIGATAVRDLYEGAHEARSGLVLRHGERGDVLAIVNSDDAVDPRMPFAVSFLSPVGDDLLHTGNGLSSGPAAPHRVIIVDPNAVALSAQWQAHLARLRELVPEAPAAPCELADLVALRMAIDSETLAKMREDRLVYASGEASYQLRLWPALRWAPRVQAGGRRRQRRLLAAAQGKGEPVAIPASEKLEAFQRIERVFAGPSPRAFWGALLIGTLLLFLLSMLTLFAGDTLPVLVGVVLFHELGHYTAMRLVGYRDTRIFFIPFFGAATIGRKPDVRAGQEVLVLLAGPMPGIVLALALLYLVPEIMHSSLGANAVLMLIGLNLLNLLPIFPLDGGRLVHRLLLAGRPLADAGFRIVGVAAFVALGLWSGDLVILFLGGFGLLGIPHGYFSAKLEARLRKQSLPSDDEEARLLSVFTAINEHAQARKAGVQVALVRDLVDRLASAPPRLLSSVAGLASYAGCFVVVAATLVKYSSSGSFDSAFTPGLARDFLALPDGPAWQCASSEVPAFNSPRVAVFACTSTSAEEAEGLRDELDFGFNSMCQQSPWLVDASDPIERARLRKARHTFRLMLEHSNSLFGEYLLEADSTRERRPGQPPTEEEIAAIKVRLAEQAAKRADNMHSWLASQEQVLGLDRKLAEMFIDGMVASNELRSASVQPLLQRLGCDPASGASGGNRGLALETSVTDKVFRIAALVMSASDATRLADYFCQAGCQALSFRLDRSSQ